MPPGPLIDVFCAATGRASNTDTPMAKTIWNFMSVAKSISPRSSALHRLHFAAQQRKIESRDGGVEEQPALFG